MGSCVPSDETSSLEARDGAVPRHVEPAESLSKAGATLDVSPKDVTLAVGQRLILTAVVRDARGSQVLGAPIRWSAVDRQGKVDAPIDQRGEFIAPWAGTFQLTATSGGASGSVTVTVPEDVVWASASSSQAPTGGVSPQICSGAVTQPLAPALPIGGGGEGSGYTASNVDLAFSPANFRGQRPREPVSALRSDRAALKTAALPPGSVNNFQFDAPILGVPGRGLNTSLNLHYNANLWFMDYDSETGSGFPVLATFDVDGDWPAPGWTLGFGKLANTGTGAMVIEADGTRHTSQASAAPPALVADTTDGSLIHYTANYSGGTLQSGVAFYPDGTRVDYGAPGANAVYPVRITDAHGNYVSITYVGNQGPAIAQISDTVGRSYTFRYDSTSRLISVSGPGLGGAERVLVRFTWGSVSLSGATFASGINVDLRGVSSALTIQSIFYPGTGTGYWFGDADSYSPYAMLRRVSERVAMVGPSPTDLASAATQVALSSAGVMRREAEYNFPTTPQALADAPGYSTATERWNGQDTGPAVTTYAWYRSTTSAPDQMDITYPDGTKVSRFAYGLHRALQAGAHPPYTYRADWRTGLTSHVDTYAGTKLLRSVAYTWEQGQNGAPRVKTQTVTDELGQALKTEYVYGASNDQLTEVREYDYDGTTFARVTKRTYVTNAGYSNLASGRYLLNLVQSVSLYGRGTDINNLPLLAQTDFTYDDPTHVLTERTGLTSYDPTFDPATQQTCVTTCPPPYCYQLCDGCPVRCHRVCEAPDPCYQTCTGPAFNPATAFRGNVTQVTTYADPATRGRPVTTQRWYDIAGNVVRTSSSAGEQTDIAFTSGTGYAWPSSVTWGSPTDATLRMTSRTDYDASTGLVTCQTEGAQTPPSPPASCATDGGRKTTFAYDPVSLRPTTVTFPSGGSSSLGFDDPNLSVTATLKDASGGVATTSKAQSNGLGAVRHTEQSGSAGTDVSDFTFDALGRLAKQSLPRASGAAAKWTSVTYDGIGRVTQVQAGDGSTTSAFYNEATRASGASTSAGSAVRTRDAWSRERWLRYDPLGALVEVIEPDPAGSGSVASAGTLRTTYAYDSRGLLTLVNQGVQARSFRYDGLGRLVRQKLAEKDATLNDSGQYVGRGGPGGVWSDAYEYDERSNVTKYTDARGVRTVVSYVPPGALTPDPFNRLRTITYDVSGPLDTASPISAAPAITYTYCGEAGAVCQGGDLTRVWRIDVAGLATSEFGYDSQQRLSSSKLTHSARPSFPFQFDYTYDTLDRLTEESYPTQYGVILSGQSAPARKKLQFAYDGASRLQGLTVDGVSRASGAIYNAVGQLTSLIVGPAGSYQLTESIGFDAATGLLSAHTVQRSTQKLMDLSYSYVDSSHPQQAGQILSVTNKLDTSRNRSFAYDALGRLSQAASGPAATPVWKQQYTYDAYGNRTGVTASGSAAPPQDGLSFGVDTTTNRISTAGYAYDAAGNLVRGQAADGSSQTYEYDAAGRLIRVKSAAGTTLEKYTYGAGRRRLITQAGETSNNRTYYAWDGERAAVEFTESDAAPSSPKYSRAYVYWSARQLVTYRMSGSTEVVEHNAADTFGPRLVVSASSATQGEQLVFPFGTRVASESTTSTSRTYDAYDRSSTTSLDYALNRYYSSVQGRFCQVDPLGSGASSGADPQSFNLFAYARNDPVNLRDPTGELYTTCWWRRTDWTKSSLPQYGIEVDILGCISYGYSYSDAGILDAGRLPPGPSRDSADAGQGQPKQQTDECGLPIGVPGTPGQPFATAEQAIANWLEQGFAANFTRPTNRGDAWNTEYSTAVMHTFDPGGVFAAIIPPARGTGETTLRFSALRGVREPVAWIHSHYEGAAISTVGFDTNDKKQADRLQTKFPEVKAYLLDSNGAVWQYSPNSGNEPRRCRTNASGR